MGKKKKKLRVKKSWFDRSSQKAEKAHKAMLDTNRPIASEKWKVFVDEMRDLGYTVVPQIQSSQFPGMYQALINLKGMQPEMFDRHKNPEKWAEIDREAAEAKAEAEAEAEVTTEDAPEPCCDNGDMRDDHKCQKEAAPEEAEATEEGSNEIDNENYDTIEREEGGANDAKE